HPRRGPRKDADGGPVAGRGRGARPSARRERAGQPTGGAGVHRRARAHAHPRAGDAGRTLRPRHSRGRPMNQVFDHVPFYPAVFVLFWGAALVFVLAMARHLRVFAAARAAGPSPFADIPARVTGLIQYAFVQTKMFKDLRAGILHAGIFWGFVLLTVGTANVVTGGVIQSVLQAPFDGVLWAAVLAMQNVVAVM